MALKAALTRAAAGPKEPVLPSATLCIYLCLPLYIFSLNYARGRRGRGRRREASRGRNYYSKFSGKEI